MKILFIFKDLSGRSGGAERIVVDLANEISRRSHEVILASYDKSDGKPFYEIDSSVELINLYANDCTVKYIYLYIKRFLTKRSAVIKWIYDNIGFLLKIRGSIRENVPDVIVAFMPSSTTVSALATIGLRVPLLASLHSEPSADFDSRERWDQNPVDRYLRRKTLSWFDRIIVLRPEYIEWFPNNIKNKVISIPNPVHACNGDYSAMRREKVIIGVGRLVKSKRYDLLLEAWSKIYQVFPEWSVEIFGDGPESGRLHAMVESLGISQTVRFRGVTSDIYSEYARAKLLCHPSEFEGFGLSIAEALSAGLPAVGFAEASGVNRLILDGTNGLLVQSGGDPASALSHALKTLLEDEGLLARFGRSSPSTVTEYLPDMVYRQWEDVLLEIIDKR